MPEPDIPKPIEAELEMGHATPILRVTNLDATLAWYANTLGFSLSFRVDDFAQVERGEAALMLCEGGQGHSGTWVYVGVSDVDALAREIRPRGATIRVGPTNYPWGARELHVTDPDGHVLRFGSEATEDEPCGDWLDSAGRLWRPQEDGSWKEIERE
jgi:uncharacterized glyoxalase superfamily protein PhnB